MAAILLFAAAISALWALRPHQVAHLEDGIFVNPSNGDTLIIKLDTVQYQGDTQPLAVWIGKGRRFLSPKGQVGNLFVIDATDGRRVPADLVLTNEANSRTVCSVQSGNESICFNRVR